MVTLHQHYHHRAPVTAKTLLLGGDLLACVLGGVYTTVEQTMIALGVHAERVVGVTAGLGTCRMLSWIGSSSSTAAETPAGVVTSVSRNAHSAPAGHSHGTAADYATPLNTIATASGPRKGTATRGPMRGPADVIKD